MKTLLKIFDDLDLLEPKCWCSKPATIGCATCLIDLCSKHSEDEHILRKHETHLIESAYFVYPLVNKVIS